jgi:hypothetical protein
LRYPQLLCLFERFSPLSGARCRKNPNSRANDRTSWPLGRLNDALARARILYRSGTERAIFINSKPQRRLLGRGETPLSVLAAFYGQQTGGRGWAV